MASRIDKLTQGKTPAEKFASMETGAQKENYLNFLRSRGKSGPVINAMRSIAPEKPLVPDQILPAKQNFLAKLGDVIAGRPRVSAQRKTENLPSRPYGHTPGPIVVPENRLSKHHLTTDNQQVSDVARSVQTVSNQIIGSVERQARHTLDTARDAALRAPPKITTVTKTEPGLLGPRTVTENIVQPARVTAHVRIQAELPSAHWERTIITRAEKQDAEFDGNTGSGNFHTSAEEGFTHESLDFDAGGIVNDSSFDISY